MRLSKAIIALAASVAFAQTAGFEVASIKPTGPDAQGSHIGISPGGAFNAKNVTLRALVRQAFGVRDFQISLNPAWHDNGWFDTAHYDILTKDTAPTSSEDELRDMTDAQRNAFRDQLTAKVRLLLSDRFQLKTHKETKEMPVYGLTVAKGGSKLQPASDADRAHMGLTIRGDKGKSEMTGTMMSMQFLTTSLAGQVGRSVIDQTGLQGDYNFKLTYAPDMAESADGPSIFTAIQEQLGLKLDSQKGPVEVLVIDTAQKASEN